MRVYNLIYPCFLILGMGKTETTTETNKWWEDANVISKVEDLHKRVVSISDVMNSTDSAIIVPRDQIQTMIDENVYVPTAVENYVDQETNDIVGNKIDSIADSVNELNDAVAKISQALGIEFEPISTYRKKRRRR